MEKELEFCHNLVKSLCGIDFHIVDNTEKAIWEHVQTCTTNDILQMLHDKVFPLSGIQSLQTGTVYEFYIAGGPCSLVFLHKDTNQLLLLGPSITEEYSKENLNKQLSERNVPQSIIHHFEDMVQSLPLIPVQNLHKAMNLLLQHYFNITTSLTVERIDYLMNMRSHMMYRTPEHDEQVSRMRQIEMRYEISAALTEAVKEGNASLAAYFLGKFHFGKDNDVRNANPLRNLQNYCIILNTQLRYALEERGIHPYLLDAFSSDIALNIEQLRTVDQAKSFAFHVIREYCNLVREHSYPNLKPLIHLAVTYIKEHLNDNLTVKDTAQALTMNANYLSSQFHAEMGINFIDFVNQERVKQASSLLRHTNLPIKDIASIVGYNNTSYFTKQFYKVYHQAPRTYRSGTNHD